MAISSFCTPHYSYYGTWTAAWWVCLPALRFLFQLINDDIKRHQQGMELLVGRISQTIKSGAPAPREGQSQTAEDILHAAIKKLKTMRKLLKRDQSRAILAAKGVISPTMEKQFQHILWTRFLTTEYQISLSNPGTVPSKQSRRHGQSHSFLDKKGPPPQSSQTIRTLKHGQKALYIEREIKKIRYMAGPHVGPY